MQRPYGLVDSCPRTKGTSLSSTDTQPRLQRKKYTYTSSSNSVSVSAIQSSTTSARRPTLSSQVFPLPASILDMCSSKSSSAPFSMGEVEDGIKGKLDYPCSSSCLDTI
ncbi:hypothetical protein K435DRAFT_783513 [Dendrothele bispora CBS 962.96]|uniref:Uncharacterized protein n=1 Tax=Dendrothele bispora (strain CBS 962.96) TaxID=1314807 RepID=A0A4S8L8X2_DENBC|nr:hypothetical protein K435DRAFT_783513 [Dendrothele bispora CBS 962.96]